ncbi:MAG: diaminopimelate decarboxylase [Ignavibacteria bacterium]|nr:diaminopimelate decarboxylase [Ignavibacteria bacterium]
MSQVYRNALNKKIVNNDDTSVIFYDLSFLEERVNELVRMFPQTTLHAIAVKSNPLKKILEFLNSLNAGAEVASLPELYLTEKSSFDPDKIVFDSPVKTMNELEYAMKLGVHINADSFTELKRIAEIMEEKKTKSSFGIRINPQVGTGTILSTSVAGEYSKFGVPIKEYRKELIKSFLEYDWLRGVHLHIGSQGCPVDLLVKGVKAVYDFVNETNDSLRRKGKKRQIDIFDIGGGLPVSYKQDEKGVTIEEYRKKLFDNCEELFSDKFKLITEFGRYVHANAGWTASRVEYVKESSGVKTAMIHTGADLFLRKCYQQDEWFHEISVLDSDGNLKNGKDTTPYIIAGPLCFAGDILSKEMILPEVKEGDYVLIHDTGAYTLSMWSRYNSRQVPKVVGYYDEGERFEILKERESLDDVLNFWE